MTSYVAHSKLSYHQFQEQHEPGVFLIIIIYMNGHDRCCRTLPILKFAIYQHIRGMIKNIFPLL